MPLNIDGRLEFGDEEVLVFINCDESERGENFETLTTSKSSPLTD